MGGLTASAAGALAKCAEAQGGMTPESAGVGMSGAATSSMAEWQMSQAEQAAEWDW